MAKSKMPEKLKLECAEVSDDSITFIGPDEDGDLSIETDLIEDAMSLKPEGARRLHDYLGRYLAKVEEEDS